MRSRRSFLVAAGLLVDSMGVSARVLHAQALSITMAQMTLVTQSGRYLLKVEVADSQPKVILGLRFRHSIPPDGGMLFPTRLPSLISISTLGLMLSTDILFVATNGEVVEIHPWAPTNSEIPIQSLLPVIAALQLSGGSVARFGIRLRDRILSPRFGQTA